MRLYLEETFDPAATHYQLGAFMYQRLREENLSAPSCTTPFFGLGESFPRDDAFFLDTPNSVEALAIRYQKDNWAYFRPENDPEIFYESVDMIRPFVASHFDLYQVFDRTPFAIQMYSAGDFTDFVRLQRAGEDLRYFVNTRR